MTFRCIMAGAIAPAALLLPQAAGAEPVVWGVQVEQLEHRWGEDGDVFAWDFDALAGTDELRVVWRSEAEFATGPEEFETLENQLRVQVPVSDFFDAVAGVRVDTPEGPDRAHAVLGLHGLAPQWFEVDADLFVSDRPFARFEAEYEALVTNRVILVPSIELEVPLADDRDAGRGAFGPVLEIGARLSYDLVDRAISPYLGVHYERAFGETGDVARMAGEEKDALFLAAGARFMF